ncbi:GIP, partial [Symbiodinium sp. CCMP2592]
MPSRMSPDEESLREGDRPDAPGPRPGGASPLMPRRAASPRAAEGAAGASEKKFVDYRMEAAPGWDGEQPEVRYKEYARNLKLWLIEATERLPGSLISSAHMSFEEITDPLGYQRIVATIEEAHDYLKDAKLEQAFDQAIFKGRRRADQSLSGFVATKKGNFTEDQKQRIKVLTDGSIDFLKVEKAIRKLFGETVDEPGQRNRTFWQGDQDGENGYGDEEDLEHLTFWEEASDYVTEAFDDLLEFDEATGETYMIIEEASTSGKDRKSPGTFGVYGSLGSYLDHRKALQDARTGRRFMSPRSERHDGRHRMSIGDLMAKTRCHQCKQLGHWARNCPQKRQGAPGRTSSGNHRPQQQPGGPTAAMFFVDPPAQDRHGYYAVTGEPSAVEQYMSEAVRATAFETLKLMDQNLQKNFGVKAQYSAEDGGTVRGVCGVVEKTPIAYVPVGVSGYSGQLRVQIVPGSVPCLVPAYLLSDLGSVIDMCSMRIYHTRLSCMQDMSQKSSGHVEVCLQCWRRLLLRWQWAFSVQAASALMEIVREPHLRVAREQESHILAGEDQEAVLRSSPTCQHVKISHGANAQWEWNTVLVYQKPTYVTPISKKQEKQKKKNVASSSVDPVDPEPPVPMSSRQRPPYIVVPEVETALPAAAMTAGPMMVDGNEDTFDIGTPASFAFPPPSSAPDMDNDFLEDTLNIMRCDPPAEHRNCPLCPGGELTLCRLQEQRLLIWMCYRDPDCQYKWQGKIPQDQVNPAWGVRLCMECQQNEVKKASGKGREAWVCDHCGDQFQCLGGLTKGRLQELENITEDGWKMIAAIVEPSRCYLWQFRGAQVPGSRNATIQAPMQKRMIFNVDEGHLNVVDISYYGNFRTYDLGTSEPVSVYVVQEFEEDFVQEVTMEKGEEATFDQAAWNLPTAHERSYWIERAQEERG